jgi:DNA-binding MarR family transcriptional regulator
MTEPDFLGAAALRGAVREFNARSDAIVRLHGLTPEQYQLLLLIRVSPREEATIGNLYKSLHRGQSAVTQLARRMENRGLIARELSTEDARVRFLKLTRRGEQRLGDAVTALSGERSQLLSLLGQIEGRGGPA